MLDFPKVAFGRPQFAAMPQPGQQPASPAIPLFGRMAADEVNIRFGAKAAEPKIDPNQVKVFTGRANKKLAREVADDLGVTLSPATLKNHNSSEVYVELGESVQGKDVFIIQPTSAPVDRNLMELLNMIDAAKQDDAKSVTAVIPYYGYARQDRRTDGKREPISAKLTAKLIKVAGADRVVLMDLHNNIQEGFFDVPVRHMTAAPVLAKYIGEKDLANAVVVSPDVNGLPRARAFADYLHLGTAAVEKKRTGHGKAQALTLIGDVRGKVAIMFDDMIDTCGTITKAAELIEKEGASRVIVVASHGVFSNPAHKVLASSPFVEVVVTNSIPMKPSIKKTGKVTQLSVGELISQQIQEICPKPTS